MLSEDTPKRLNQIKAFKQSAIRTLREARTNAVMLRHDFLVELK